MANNVCDMDVNVTLTLIGGVITIQMPIAYVVGETLISAEPQCD